MYANYYFLTTKFYFQNQSPKCRVDGYKFRSVYKLILIGKVQGIDHMYHCNTVQIPVYRCVYYIADNI